MKDNRVLWVVEIKRRKNWGPTGYSSFTMKSARKDKIYISLKFPANKYRVTKYVPEEK